MAPLLLVLLLQAPPAPSTPTPEGAVVMISRRTGVTETRAAGLANRVYAELIAVNVPVREHPSKTLENLLDAGVDPTTCEAAPACLGKLAARSGAAAVISVDVGAVMDDLAVHLQAVGVDGGSLAEETFVAAASGSPAELAAQIEPFAKRVAKLKALRPAAPTDAPRAAALTPVPTSPSVPAEAVAAGPPRTGAWVATAGAGALAVSAVAFGFMGLQRKNEFDAQVVPGSEPTEYRRSRAQMDSLAASTNQSFAIAGGSAVAAAATGAFAAYLWTRAD